MNLIAEILETVLTDPPICSSERSRTPRWLQALGAILTLAALGYLFFA